MATPRLARIGSLRGADGLPLHVDLRTAAREGEMRPLVVICHGFKGFKDWGFFPRVAERLAVAGFTAVSFNFSGSGVGDADTFDQLDRWARQTLTGDLRDLNTVIDHFAPESSRRVGLLGHSRGGGLAILQAARDGRVAALATWAAVAGFMRWPEEELRKWRDEGRIEVLNTRTGQLMPIHRQALDDFEANREALDVAAAASRLRIPWLLVHGKADESVAFQEGERLCAAAGCPVEFERVEGAGHTFGIKHPWSGSTPVFDAVLDRTVQFFTRNLA
jgi:pimeloyl-ACP methyl ester carboxylesterase